MFYYCCSVIPLQPGEESVDKLVDEAREVFSGSVYAADDLWTYNIPLHKT